MTFVERIGGILVRPRPTLAEVAREGGTGARDITILLVLRILAGETITLARALASVPALGFEAGLRGLLHAITAILPDLLGLLAGAVVMGLLAGKKAVRGRELDVAVYAWVPYLALSLFTALANTALQRRPGPVEQTLFAAAAVAWSIAVWTLGLLALRRAPAPEVPA